MSYWIYEGTTGLIIDTKIFGVESLEGVTDAKLFVLPPDGSPEEEWPVSVIEENFVFRHIVPPEKPLQNGVYRLQPSFKLGEFHGRWRPYQITIYEKQALT